ncbi:hypothetical protein IWW50_004229 [Coemansia erecta]|nr:hypothetical protein IWW50_004229 [Coemansia erecta]
MSDTIHNETIAAGLQRQLDELREIIQGGNGSLTQQSAQADDSTKQLQGEIEKQRVRIVHLLRALDDKDRIIGELQTRNQLGEK